MKKILINKDGYVKCIYVTDATIELEISDDTYLKIKCTPISKVWRYINGNFILEYLKDDVSLKNIREIECFRVIDNRSTMWYNHLTEQQKQELEEWYQAWLDVTKTKEIPIKPEWLK